MEILLIDVLLVVKKWKIYVNFNKCLIRTIKLCLEKYMRGENRVFDTDFENRG